MPSIDADSVFDAVYPDRIRQVPNCYWVVDRNCFEKVAADPLSPYNIHPEGVFPDSVHVGRRGREEAYLRAGAFSAAEFVDQLQAVVLATRMLPVYPDRVLPSPAKARPHLMESFFWRSRTPVDAWSEPALSSNTSTWAEHPATDDSGLWGVSDWGVLLWGAGQAGTGASWTQPAITPTISLE